MIGHYCEMIMFGCHFERQNSSESRALGGRRVSGESRCAIVLRNKLGCKGCLPV